MKTINYELFDKWMDEELYIRPKKKRTEIINLYKRMIKANVNVSEFEEGLEKLGWDETTIKSVSDYLMIWNVKDKANARLMKKQEDYKFIKKFTKISVKKICDDEMISYANLITGRASAYNMKIVRERLEEEIKKLEE